MKITLSPEKSLGMLALGSALLFDYIFFTTFLAGDTPNGISFFLGELVFINALLFAANSTKKRLFPLWYFCAALAAISTLAPFVTSSRVGLSIAGINIFVTNILMIISFVNAKDLPTTFFPFITWFVIQPLEKLIQSIARLFEKIGAFWKKQSNVGRAMLMGIPTAFITLLLLAHADPLLAKGMEIIFQVLPKIFFLHLVMMLFATGGLFVLFLASTLPETETPHHIPRRESPLSWSLVLILLNIPLALFAFSQLATYILQNTGVLDFTLSYSAYATRGIFEGCVATLFCGGIAYLAWVKEREENQQKLTIPTAILASMLILVTIITEIRIVHYIQLFGFTPLRICGIFGILTLFFCITFSTIFLLQRKPHKALMASIALALLFLTFTPLIRLDVQSVQLNIMRATNEYPFDSTLAQNLSTEAFPILLRAVEEGVPMNGMLQDCTKEKRAYSKFICLLNTSTHDERVINKTLPQSIFRTFTETHTLPQACKKYPEK